MLKDVSNSTATWDGSTRFRCHTSDGRHNIAATKAMTPQRTTARVRRRADDVRSRR
jgi:hypothetical protein